MGGAVDRWRRVRRKSVKISSWSNIEPVSVCFLGKYFYNSTNC